MFPFRKKSSSPDASETPPATRPRKPRDPETDPRFYEVPWIRNLIGFCVVLLVVAGLIEAYVRINRYANRVVTNEFVPANGTPSKIVLSAELMNRPAWLDKAIIDQIFSETVHFASRDQATYDRLLNPLDKEILKEVADNYTGTDAAGVNHWALRDNAWIKSITEVRRVISRDRKSEKIEIYADYRQPAAWVHYGDKFYLIDNDFVRLPGDYSDADHKATAGLMTITGVQLPDGDKTVPQPSDSWQTDDLAAGMKLVALLRTQPFATQIAAIDMTNYEGRKDKLAPWILLDTIWPTTDSATAAANAAGSENAGSGGGAPVVNTLTPRVVDWGRPIGEEKFYEVSAAAKIKALTQIYLRFNRIDANRDYVDIRTEEVRLPKLATEADDTAPTTHG